MIRACQIPNAVSALRILLIVPIALVLLRHEFGATLWLFGVAAATDALDGYLAKRFGWRTELGGMLDPAADKLLIASVFVLLALLNLVPVWLTAAVLGRDLVIIAGAVAYRTLLGTVKARPSLISKLNTLCQVSFVLSVIAMQRFGWPAPWLITALGALVFVTVVISGADYVWEYSRLAAASLRLRRTVTRTGGPDPA